MKVSLLSHDLHSFRYIPSSGIAMSSLVFKNYILQVYSHYRFLWCIWTRWTESVLKGYTILVAIEEIWDSWEKVKYQHQRNLKEVYSNPHLIIEGQAWDFSKRSNCRCSGNHKRTKSRSKQWERDRFLLSHEKYLMDMELFFIKEHRN